jgi:hypothetical protein
MIRIPDTTFKKVLSNLIIAVMVLSGCGGGGGNVEIPTFWNARNSGTSNTLFGIGTFANQAVAVGALGTIVTSSDGLSWITRNSGVVFHLNGVAASSTKAIAVGDNGTIISSADLVTWVPETSNTMNRLRGVAWTTNQFVAVGDAGTIVTSPDGTTWTSQSGASGDLYGVAGNASIIVAVGAGVFTSPTGVTWTPRNSAIGSPARAVVWSGTQFLAVGPALVLGNVQTSFDGTSWTARQTGHSTVLYAATWSGLEFMTVGQGRNTLRSADGIGWVSESIAPGIFFPFDGNGIAWHGGRFVVVGTSGRIFTAP